MNEVDVRILSLYEKIKRTNERIKAWKALAGLCLFISVCFCIGALRYSDSVDPIMNNLVWFVSFVGIITFYTFNVRCLRNNKECEFEIYRLETEDLNDRKELATITGEILSDNILNKQIEKPDENVQLPILYYGILLGIVVVIRIYLAVNGIL